MMEFKTSEVINCESRDLSKKAEGPVVGRKEWSQAHVAGA